jgi:hypothetical protein
MNEQQKAQFAEGISGAELTINLTGGQCNLIDTLIRLARGSGDLAEYDGDLTAIEHAIIDARVAYIEAIQEVTR